MAENPPDTPPPSESVPASVVEAMCHQVTQLARHFNEYVQYQHDLNEKLSRRVERLEKRLAARRTSSR
jgi:hypothetical protein